MGELTVPSTRITIPWYISPAIFLGGCFVFLLNLLSAAVEVEQVRTLAPARVLQDDLSQRPLEPKKKKNPWDET